MANEPYPPNSNRMPEARAQREAHWRNVLAQWKASGLSRGEFSRREGISGSALSWWSGEIRRRDRGQRRPSRPRRRSAPPKPAPARAAFIPVRMTRSAATSPPKPVEVLVLGRVIRVQPEFDPETFRRIVQVLEGWPTLAEIREDGTC